MKHAYFPGCSLLVSNKPYDVSVRALMSALGHEVEELPDWNCCGATAYMSVRELSAFLISARNLALAAGKGHSQLLTACSACYTTLNKTNHYFAEDPSLRTKMGNALAAAGLTYGGGVEVRHILDVIVNDVGKTAIKAKVVRPLEGLRVAAYYGCQLTRPYASFDDAEQPQTMDELLSWVGASPVEFSLKSRCCGGMLMSTEPDVALGLVRSLLANAAAKGANVIATACPLCQINLEAYQDKVNSRFGTNFSMPVAYFTQIVGVALGLAPAQVGLGKELVPTAQVFAQYVRG